MVDLVATAPCTDPLQASVLYQSVENSDWEEEMNNAESTEKCAHTPCKCPAQSGDEYCSTHCRNAAGGAETNCSCGHSECL
jgi:hypothetical protein